MLVVVLRNLRFSFEAWQPQTMAKKLQIGNLSNQQGLAVMKYLTYILVALFVIISVPITTVVAAPLEKAHPVEQLVGEQLSYDVSFLWFKHLAEGSICLTRGEQPGTYLAVMEARTLGFASFVTKNRIEKYQTVMEIGPNGLLRPLIHSSHTFKGTGDAQKEKLTSYQFDYLNKQVQYKKIKYNRVDTDELLPLETDVPVYDILSAFYNLRLEAFGSLDKKIQVPTFHRKGVEEIVVVPATELKNDDRNFFSAQGTLCKVLVDPSIFKTNGRELFVSFDKSNRLERGIIKNVIGLGDVKGVLRHTTTLAQVAN